MKFCLVLILLILKLTQKVSGQCMQFQFTSQPPTELNCNPYDVKVDPAVWRLRVSCDVQRISGTDQFDIHWFHKNNENETVDFGRGEVQGNTDDRERIVLGTQWINKPFNESMLGEYWCQVIVTSTQPNKYLGKSDILVIHDPGDYNTTRCNGIISVPTSKCADKNNISLQVFAANVSSTSYRYSSSSSFKLPSLSFTGPSSISPSVHYSSITSLVIMQTSISVLSSSKIPSVVIQSSDTKQNEITSISTTMTLQSPIISSSTSPTTSLSSMSTSSSSLSPSPSSTSSFSSELNPGPTNPIATQTLTNANSEVLANSFSPLIDTPDPSGALSQLNSGNNTQLIIMAGSIGGAMFLLIILLLIIICVLVCIKNGRKQDKQSGSNGHVYPMSSIRTSSSHLLSNSDLSLNRQVNDSTTFQTNYQQAPQQEEIVYAEPQTRAVPLLDHRYSIIRDSFTQNHVGHYSTQENPWSSMKHTPLLSDNYLDSSTFTGVSPEQSYSSLNQPSTLPISPVYMDEYSKLHTSHSSLRQLDESPHHKYHQLDHSMKQQPQAVQDYSKLDRSGNFGKVSNTLEESLGQCPPSFHNDQDTQQKYNQLDHSMKLESQPVQGYSKLDRSGNFEKVYNTLDMSLGHSDDHDANRPPREEYNRLDHSTKLESQPVQDYSKLGNVSKGKYKPLEMSLEQSPQIPQNALEKMFDDPRYSMLGSIATDSKVLEHYEYSTDLISQQSYDEATEMGGVEVVNNPKNVLLPNPKGSLKSKYSGNYEQDPGYTPVIPKSKQRQMN